MGGLWDTAGQEDYDRLRPVSYPSFKNVSQKWVPEISHHAPGVPVILVGTKSDLRKCEETQARLAAKNMKFVQPADIEQKRNDIGANKYIECSALTQEGLKEVFDNAIRAALYKPKKKKKGGCTLL